MFKNNFFNKIFNGSNVSVNNVQVSGNDKTIITGAGNSVCTINGKMYSGNNICIVDGTVYVDGKVADSSYSNTPVTIIVKVDGNVDSVSTGSGDVDVTGHVGKVSTGSGDVDVRESCTGNISTGSGDVQVGGCVYGSVKTGSGNVEYNC